MPITSINRAKTITFQLPESSSEISNIYSNSGLTVGAELIPGHKIVSFNSFLKNLKAYASLASLEEAPLPQFELDDSQTTKTQKILDLEWKSPRKQLNLYIGIGNQGYFPIGSLSLLNPYGYPFRIYTLMDFFTDNLALELGENSKIGIQVQDVGYGLLTPDDKVTIHGSYVEEIFVESSDNVNYTFYISGNQVGAGDTPTQNGNNQNSEDDEMADWTVVESDYTAKVKDKIVALPQENDITITLPSNPQKGNPVKVARLSESFGRVILNAGGKSFNGAPADATISLVGNYNAVDLVYIGDSTGWSCFTYRYPSIDFPQDPNQAA